MAKINIAIDGPSGSGKSTLAKNIAKKLNILYLDTGAMFRCLGLKALEENLDVKNHDCVIELLGRTVVDVKYIDGKMNIFLDGIEVSDRIRENGVSKMASDISAIKEVREFLIGTQRKIAEENDVVLDGRDIGTVVLPSAKHKFFLVADSKVRAMRRHLELLSRGDNVPLEIIQRQIEGRDYNDSTRAVAPLKKADDAKEIDATNISADQVLSIVLKCIEENN